MEIQLFHFQSWLNAPQKIVHSLLRCHLQKAASELGLHYFLWYLVHAYKFTNIFDLFYLCFLKPSIMLNVKVVPNNTFKFGSEKVTGVPRSVGVVYKLHDIVRIPYVFCQLTAMTRDFNVISLTLSCFWRDWFQWTCLLHLQFMQTQGSVKDLNCMSDFHLLKKNIIFVNSANWSWYTCKP